MFVSLQRERRNRVEPRCVVIDVVACKARTVAWLQAKPVEMMSNSTLPLGFLHSNIIMLNLKYQIIGNQRQQKAEKRVKYPRLLGSVDYSNYLCK